MFSNQTAISKRANHPSANQPLEVVRVTLPNHRGELVVYCDRPIDGESGEPVFSFGLLRNIEKVVDGSRL